MTLVVVTAVALLLSSNLCATGIACSATCKEAIEDDLQKTKPNCVHNLSKDAITIEANCINNSVVNITWNTHSDDSIDKISIEYVCHNTATKQVISQGYIDGHCDSYDFQNSVTITFPIKKDVVCTFGGCIKYSRSCWYRNEDTAQCSYLPEPIIKLSLISSSFLSSSQSTDNYAPNKTIISSSFHSNSYDPTKTIVSSSFHSNSNVLTLHSTTNSILSSTSLPNDNWWLQTIMIFPIAVFILLLGCIGVFLIFTLSWLAYKKHFRVQRQTIDYTNYRGSNYHDHVSFKEQPCSYLYKLDEISLSGSVVTIEHPLDMSACLTTNYLSHSNGEFESLYEIQTEDFVPAEITEIVAGTLLEVDTSSQVVNDLSNEEHHVYTEDDDYLSVSPDNCSRDHTTRIP